MNNYIEQLKQIRKEQKVSQTELAKRTGFKQQYICALESNKIPNVGINTIQKVANALGYEIKIIKQE